MSFLELTKDRRSIRSFKNKDLSSKQLKKLLEAARWAPSAGNCQPWYFYVVKNNDLKEKLVEAALGQKFIAEAPAVIVVCAEAQRNTGRYGERGKELYCIQDTAAAVQNILLTAKDLGLGTCWVGAFDEKSCSEVLELPQKMRPVAMVPVGYPKHSPSTSSRRPVEQISEIIE